MFVRIKPKIIMVPEGFYLTGNMEKIELKYCPKYKDDNGGCSGWNSGRGSAKCCECWYAVWEPPVIKV